MRRLILAPLAPLAMLAACGEADEPALPPGEATPATETPAPTASPSVASAIPAALQGRWGLVAADCEPGRADAKGLLVVSANKLEFYESVGTLGPVSESDASSLRALFAFTGEGMTWTRDMQLTVEGDTLVRREFGADAAPEPFSYSRCS